MNVPEDLKYAASHEWIRLADSIGTVGITEHAQAELTDIVYVELPKVGRKVVAGETIAVVESVKAASDIYAPVSGEISEINSALEATPALLNTDPFNEGWLYKIQLSDVSELAALKDAAAYASQIGGAS